MKLNVDQEKAIHRDRNVVVTAGAGSGKTSVLALRYLRLLREGKAGVENILTLTFTKKAAAEMYERIHRLLAEEQDNEAVRRALETFENAQISTIDSFCSRIVRNDPGRYGMPGNFVQDTEEETAFAEKEAVDFILDNRNNTTLQKAVLRFGFEKVWKDLFASLAREYFSLAEEHDFNTLAAAQRRFFLQTLDTVLTDLHGVETDILALRSTRFAAITGAQGALAGFSDRLQRLVSDEHFSALIEEAAAVKLSKSLGNTKDDTALIFKELADRFRDILSDLVSLAHTLSGWGDMEALFALCGQFQDRFLRRKRETGVLTFRDVADMARDILLHNHEIRRHYKNTFRYIMIDEFQDNNRLQKDLLYLLAEKNGREGEGIPRPEDLEEDKLFFVGDEKQSIYRFRGADVSVIKDLSKELAPDDTGGIELSTNYRSEPALIDFFNRIFTRVMDGATEPYEAEFAPLASRQRELPDSPVISLFYKPWSGESGESGEGFLDSDDAEAFYLASFIRERVKRGDLKVSEDGAVRPAEYGDFAVLMRSTGGQIRYERMFRRLGVPYETQDVRALFLEAPVNDLYAALECAVYPEDRLALAAFLRSPFANLSDAGFARVLLTAGRAFTGEEVTGLSPDDAARYAAAGEMIGELRQRADRHSIVSLLYYLWFDRGYRYIILRRPAYHGYLEYFEYLRELAYAADRKGVSLAAFLDRMRPKLGNYEKMPELSLLRGSTRGVQLMTIHKSKGLQFPVVIIANMGNAGKSGDDGKPYYLSDIHGPAFRTLDGGTVKKNYIYDSVREEEKARDLAELKRLLYVAATRARNHLFFSGCHNSNNRSKEGVMLNMLLAAAGFDPKEPLFSKPSDMAVREIPDITEEDLRSAAVRRKIRSLAAAAENYRRAEVPEYAARRDEWPASELNRLYAETLGRVQSRTLPPVGCDEVLSDGSLAAEFGTWCHAFIEHALTGSGGPPPEPPPGLSALPKGDLQLVRSEAEALARGFLDSPFLAGLPKGAVFHSERLLMYRCEGSAGALYISAQPDLFIETPGENIIVDFKSDKHILKGHYDLQLALYVRAAEAMTGRRTRAYLYYLRGGDVVETASAAEDFSSFLRSL
ncbi:MAG: UvrD-helicase domain-containing protein [Spirochaetales bacterium]|nr:UvrD-helicase domain-containing protein [Spirochaetales bacterium]